MKLENFIIEELCKFMKISEHDIASNAAKRLRKKGCVEINKLFPKESKNDKSIIDTLVNNGLLQFYIDGNILISITLDPTMRKYMEDFDYNQGWNNVLDWYCEDTREANVRNAVKLLSSKMEPMLKASEFNYVYNPIDGMVIYLHDQNGDTHKYTAHLLFIISALPELSCDVIYDEGRHSAALVISFNDFSDAAFDCAPSILGEVGKRYRDTANVFSIFEDKDIETLYNLIVEGSKKIFWKKDIYSLKESK